MKYIGFILNFFALILFLLVADAHAVNRCSPTVPQDFLYEEDFPWNQTLDQILKNADVFYVSPKRLQDRAFRNSKGEVLIPVTTSNGRKFVRTSETFIKSITKHIEEGLKRRYVDAINFSDMGHSHFFIPQKYYDEVVDPIPVSDKHLLYEKILNHPGLKILYHTAEQLTMLDQDKNLLPDRHIQWRFFTRNLVGDNEAQGKLELLHNESHRYNTAHDYEEGYRYWGGGFYLSAHENGCFPFKEKENTFYFDINLEGINTRNPI